MMYYQNKQTGFSLVETLVAVSLLLIVIVGPMTISARTAKSSSFASEQVQAFFLAQEGLELAQAARDEVTLKYFKGDLADPWAEFIDESGGDYQDCFSSVGCGLQWDSGNSSQLAMPIKCNNPSDDCRLYRSASGRSHFNHNSAGNTETLFTRTIYFEKIGPNPVPEVRVRSVVTWRTGSIVASQQVEVDTYLYNIYDPTF